MVHSAHILSLFRRRWSLPVLSTLHDTGGCKFVTLCHQLDAHQSGVRDALDHLIELGWVQPNPGHGHPLRPEYILTPHGERLAPSVSALNREIDTLQLSELCLRRWSLPVLGAVADVRAIEDVREARFAQISAHLPITPRALSQTLKDLSTSDLIHRSVVEEYPPRPTYRLSSRAEPLADAFALVRESARRIGA